MPFRNPKITLPLIRNLAVLLLIPVGLVTLTVQNYAPAMTIMSHGPIQIGHQELTCVQCHQAAEGTWRQQAQANMHFAIGSRQHDVYFGYKPVTSSTCLDCHDRPNDRHPIYRFQEPRFIEALETVDATSCLACHSEHTAAVSFASGDYCVACHMNLKFQSDPLDVSHAELIEQENWTSCLGCHDYHGNHVFDPPEKLERAFSTDEIEAYFGSGPDPYGSEKYFKVTIR